MAEVETKENSIVVEDSQTSMLAKGEASRFTALVQSTTDAVTETGLLLMAEELGKYKKCMAARMLALNDTTFHK